MRNFVLVVLEYLPREGEPQSIASVLSVTYTPERQLYTCTVAVDDEVVLLEQSRGTRDVVDLILDRWPRDRIDTAFIARPKFFSHAVDHARIEAAVNDLRRELTKQGPTEEWFKERIEHATAEAAGVPDEVVVHLVHENPKYEVTVRREYELGHDRFVSSVWSAEHIGSYLNALGEPIPRERTGARLASSAAAQLIELWPAELSIDNFYVAPAGDFTSADDHEVLRNAVIDLIADEAIADAEAAVSAASLDESVFTLEK